MSVSRSRFGADDMLRLHRQSERSHGLFAADADRHPIVERAAGKNVGSAQRLYGGSERHQREIVDQQKAEAFHVARAFSAFVASKS